MPINKIYKKKKTPTSLNPNNLSSNIVGQHRFIFRRQHHDTAKCSAIFVGQSTWIKYQTIVNALQTKKKYDYFDKAR